VSRDPSILVVAAAAGAVLLALAGAAPQGGGPTERAFDSKCGGFPDATGTAADAPSLPDQRAWNQDISGAPVDPASVQIIEYVNSHGDTELHPDFGPNRKFGIPYEVVGKRTDAVNVRFAAYGAESDKGRYRIPLSAPVEGGPRGDGDRHVIAYDKSRCKLYELFNAFPKRRRWVADGGAIWNLRSAGLRKAGYTSADAAGLPIFPGLASYHEVRAGAIDHALRVTFESTRDAWINPASHCAGDTSSADAPPMGLRLRLEASYDTSAITGQAAVIAAALKRYGLIVADNGSNGDLNQLKAIPTTAFEVVQSEADPEVC
jgi:hypothetical protein